MTISSLLSTATERLARANIDSPRLTAELLLGHLLQVARIALVLRAQDEIDTTTAEQFESLLSRRLIHEPIQHIMGETEWYGLKIKCDRRALIPRPETEIVVERALEMINDRHAPAVLDIGTGTGCIAIAVATEVPHAVVCGSDSSNAALELARENLTTHAMTERINLRHSHLFEAWRGQSFDLVISNPPYIRAIEYPNLMPEVRSFEPEAALVAGEDGLDVIRALIADAPAQIKVGGFLVIEFGINHALPIRRLAETDGRLAVLDIFRDYNGHERGIILQRL